MTSIGKAIADGIHQAGIGGLILSIDGDVHEVTIGRTIVGSDGETPLLRHPDDWDWDVPELAVVYETFVTNAEVD